ncbi:hypothetical protein SERLA73DRAFT_184433 [Serpula lacrymans var. lacrymans S7.3]|uniref:Uncharacterized protein n=2 Tax=Serpula lacrymans var. lacrymans TaxID=341189 RepID=F8Q384_SERL3|nr:uncharacterized protein SERLADRAFT_371466 [Serpula lacrymans var. lacrymans S7.9]EGN97645.1 hypothetical protein SERLA73DRAFT_184433 [Serpula lacrymans var. lacrymans S7.3]EGO23239.1 hypothetical protein SERLADRAFT_371466 [Serpula lacrymans var. lacrymans S7.9]
MQRVLSAERKERLAVSHPGFHTRGPETSTLEIRTRSWISPQRGKIFLVTQLVSTFSSSCVVLCTGNATGYITCKRTSKSSYKRITGKIAST